MRRTTPPKKRNMRTWEPIQTGKDLGRAFRRRLHGMRRAPRRCGRRSSLRSGRRRSHDITNAPDRMLRPATGLAPTGFTHLFSKIIIVVKQGLDFSTKPRHSEKQNCRSVVNKHFFQSRRMRPRRCVHTVGSCPGPPWALSLPALFPVAADFGCVAIDDADHAGRIMRRGRRGRDRSRVWNRDANDVVEPSSNVACRLSCRIQPET